MIDEIMAPPTKFTSDMAEVILDEIIEGTSYRAICKKVGIGLRTLHYWTYESNEKRRKSMFKKDFSIEVAAAMRFSGVVMDGDAIDEAKDRSRDTYKVTKKDGTVCIYPNNAAVSRSNTIIAVMNESKQHRNPDKFAKRMGQGDVTNNSVHYTVMQFGQIEVKEDGGFKPKRNNIPLPVQAKRLSIAGDAGDGSAQ